MSPIQRELLLSQRRRTAERAAGRMPGVRDEPIDRTEIPRSGIARIDSNEGDGAYKVTELWWDPDEGDWVAGHGPLGLEQASAVDYMNTACGVVGQIVRFWEHRGLGGQVVLLVDVNGSYAGSQRASSFCVHYSGTNTTGSFHSVPECKNSLLEVGIDLRHCSGNGSSADHPGYTELALTGGYMGFGWCNALATWSGGDWYSLKYMARQANGTIEGDGTNAVMNFHIQCRVTAAGNLDFRLENLTGGWVSAVIVAAMRILPFGDPPGVIELGNCCCHDDPDWNCYEWGEHPDNPL